MSGVPTLFLGADLGSEYMKISYIEKEVDKEVKSLPDINDNIFYIPLCFNKKDKNLIRKDAESIDLENKISFLRHSICQNTDYFKKLKNNFLFGATVSEEETFDNFSNIISVINKMIETKSKAKSKKSIFTVPSHFTKDQRSKLLKVVEKAKIGPADTITEATSLCYFYSKANNLKDQKFLVINIGSTIEMTEVEMKGDKKFTVLNTLYSTFLIGKYIDNIIYQIALEEFFSQNTDVNIYDVSKAKLDELMNECVKAKCALSTKSKEEITINSFVEKRWLIITISKDKVEDRCGYALDLIGDMLGSIECEEGTKIIITGLTTKLSFVYEQINDYLGDYEILKQGNELQVQISCGAALISELGTNVVEENISKITTKHFDYEIPPVLHSNIGIKESDGKFKVMILKGTQIPTFKPFNVKIRLTECWNAAIEFYEGSSPNIKENALLDTLYIPPISRNHVYIRVMMRISKDGVLTVEGRTRNNLINERIESSGSINFTDREIEERRKDNDKREERSNALYVYNLYLNNLSRALMSYEGVYKSKLEELLNWFLQVPNDTKDIKNKIIEVRERFSKL